MKNCVIIGAGLYGLYAALYLARRKCGKITVLEQDAEAFSRATYVNQARVHKGYHYPRSLSTAEKSAHYFQRFLHDYEFAILTKFDQIYATSSRFSWTDAREFERFCKIAKIRCESIDPALYFNDGMCDGAFLTEEYTYSASRLRDYFLTKLALCDDVEIHYRRAVVEITKEDGRGEFVVTTIDGKSYHADFVLNATYASTNQISALLGLSPFDIKYELCEVILCEVNDRLKSLGITVMDGPFFSIMPFGYTKYHSLTSVAFTPHDVCRGAFPYFECQKKVSSSFCTPDRLGNCNECKAHPASAYPYMSNLARKYMKSDFAFKRVKSLYSMKPILKTSEIDDSRPTMVRTWTEDPTYVSVLSGKINTVYDLDEVLEDV